MAKKTSRAAKTPATKTTKPAEQATPAAAEAPVVPPTVDEQAASSLMPRAPRAGTKPRLSRSQATIEQLKEEYAYVTKDLRSVFILAAAMFLLLIAANLVLPLLGI